MLLILLFFLAPTPVYAYLDPGTGSYFFQLAIGGLLGGAYLIKTFWKDIKRKLSGILGKNKKEEKEV